MKIRYYLRGLGLGILVTAIFFMVSGKQSQTMSDEMIKARAKELGMSESVVLAEMATQEEKTIPVAEEETIPVVEEETVPVAEEEMNTTEALTEEAVSKEASEEVSFEEETTVTETTEEAARESAIEEEPIEEAVSEEAVSKEPVVVTVNRGEGSDTVSRRLQEAGLVADAHEYDRYLMANGYDKRIGAGEHSIPAGATWEDIAKILCNMK